MVLVAKRRDQAGVVMLIGLVELLALRQVGFLDDDQLMQHVVEELAHEAEQRVGAGAGQHLMEFDFQEALAPLVLVLWLVATAVMDIVLKT